MTRKIINSKQLAEMVGRDRSRIARLIAEGRITPDYEDEKGHPYWTPRHAERIARAFKEHEKAGGRGPGSGIVFERKRKSDPTRLNPGSQALERPESPLRHV